MNTPNSTGTSPVVTTLTELVERCKDGVLGYRTAVKDVEDNHLKQLFEKFATQRDNNITELQDYLHRGGHTATETSSIEGTLHRAWINLSSALAAKDRRRVLEECERGEDYAVSAYRKALEVPNLPPEATALIQKQYQIVQTAHDQIRDLRDQSERVNP